MSSIASFYLIPKQEVPELLRVAKLPVEPIKRKFLWFELSPTEWHDPFWSSVHEKAVELEDFGYSGHFFSNELYFFLESHSIVLEQFADTELSDVVSTARNSWLLVFNSAGATRLRDALTSLQLDPVEVAAFLNSPELKLPGDEEDWPAEAVFDGVATLKSWMSQVNNEYVSLLWVG